MSLKSHDQIWEDLQAVNGCAWQTTEPRTVSDGIVVSSLLSYADAMENFRPSVQMAVRHAT